MFICLFSWPGRRFIREQIANKNISDTILKITQLEPRSKTSDLSRNTLLFLSLVEANTYIHTYFICHKVKVWQLSLMWTSSTTKVFKNKLKILNTKILNLPLTLRTQQYIKNIYKIKYHNHLNNL